MDDSPQEVAGALQEVAGALLASGARRAPALRQVRNKQVRDEQVRHEQARHDVSPDTLCLMTAPRQRSTQAPDRAAGATSARQRLVDVAVARILREGMTVGLEHLSLEQVIAQAGVSRATAYRHWPHKADFLREVLVTTVRTTRLVGESPRELHALAQLLRSSGDLLRTAQGRRDVVVEGLRVSAQADYDRIAGSPQWQTYLAISATCRGLPPGSLRAAVRAELAATEAGFVAHRAAVYARLPGLLGYRLTPPLSAPQGYRVMAGAAGAMMTGLVVAATATGGTESSGGSESSGGTDATGGIDALGGTDALGGMDPFGGSAGSTVRLAPFGSSQEADWSLPALHLVTVLLAHLEPDPDVVWDAARRQVTADRLEEVLTALVADRADRADLRTPGHARA